MTAPFDRRMFSTPQRQFADPLAALALVREIAGWAVTGDADEVLIDELIIRARNCLHGAPRTSTAGGD